MKNVMLKLKQISQIDKKYMIFNIATFMGMFFLSGICNYVYKEDSLPSCGYLILICVIATVSAIFFGMALSVLVKICVRKKVNNFFFDKGQKGNLKWFFCFWIIYILIWGCSFLAYYPGIIAYDLFYQVGEVGAGEYSTHHPLLHTVFVGYSWKMGVLNLGSGTTGIAIATIIQVIAMASVFSYVSLSLVNFGLKKWMSLLLCFFIALYPLNVYYSVSHTKDVLFSVFFLLTIVFMIEFAIKTMNKSEKRIKTVFFIGAITLMIMLRNNGIYCVIPTLILYVTYLFRGEFKKKYIKMVVIVLLAIILAFSAKSILKIKSDAVSGDVREMLSVPIQQIARTVEYHKGDLDETTLQEVNSYFKEGATAKYRFLLSDPVKVEFDSEVMRADLPNFIRLYFSLLVKYPQDYICAVIHLYGGYININDKSICDVYSDDWISTIMTQYPEWYFEGYDIKVDSKLPALKDILERIAQSDVLFTNPIIKWLFVPCVYCWATVFYLGYIITYKKRDFLPSVLMMTMLICTCLLGPASLVRYVYPIIISLPYMLLVSIKGKS